MARFWREKGGIIVAEKAGRLITTSFRPFSEPELTVECTPSPSRLWFGWPRRVEQKRDGATDVNPSDRPLTRMPRLQSLGL